MGKCYCSRILFLINNQEAEMRKVMHNSIRLGKSRFAILRRLRSIFVFR
jgi:hypothetical protein